MFSNKKQTTEGAMYDITHRLQWKFRKWVEIQRMFISACSRRNSMILAYAIISIAATKRFEHNFTSFLVSLIHAIAYKRWFKCFTNSWIFTETITYFLILDLIHHLLRIILLLYRCSKRFYRVLFFLRDKIEFSALAMRNNNILVGSLIVQMKYDSFSIDSRTGTNTWIIEEYFAKLAIFLKN